MRHRVAGRHLSRNTSHRLALYSNQVNDLFNYGKIVTTEAKAKEVRSLAEKMITLGRADDLSARRQALAFMKNKAVVKKMFKSTDEDNPMLDMVEAMLKEMPLRSMLMMSDGALKRSTLDALLLMINGSFFRGLFALLKSVVAKG